MQIIGDKALHLRVKNPARITASIRKSKQLGPHEVAVHWGLEEASTLRQLGISAPSPIEGRYNWPGRFKPMAHQKETAAFLTLHERAFVLSDPGTGKTASAIWAADYLMKLGKVHRVLVVCPVSIMDAAWRADLFTFAMHRSADIAHGDAKRRKKVLESGAEFVIINFDGLEVVRDEIAAGGFDLIIVDEATAYKNTATQRWKVLHSLLRPGTRLWMMTGTPAAQGPEDAYGLARLVSPHLVPKYKGAFRDMVMTKVSQFRWVPKSDATETVHRVLQPAIRFAKEDCLDLPDILYTRREVPMTKQQGRYYHTLRKQMLFEAAGEQVRAANAAVLLNKLLQISAGAAYSDSGDILQFDIRARYAVLKEVIDETDRKVLVFIPYKHSMRMLEEALRNDGYACAVISGEVTPTARAKIFQDFQTASDPRILLIQPQAAAHGVTLTAADTVVWWSPTPSLETYVQANARIHRKGQTHKCTVVQLYSSPAEQRIYGMLDDKIDVHTKLVDLYRQIP
jgi:SNF2 family DNA or RNA helicase